MTDVVSQVLSFIDKAGNYTKSRIDQNPDNAKKDLLKFLELAADFIISKIDEQNAVYSPK